jgi:DNA polymerase I-like protein with 3'-5' exonuclease and polymerase domains
VKEPIKYCPQHDIHAVFAAEVFPGFQDFAGPVKKEMRDLTKRVEYGGFYKGSIDTLYNSIVKEMPTVKYNEVAKAVQIIASRMPGVNAWHQDLVRQAMQGEIRSAIFGRRRTFPLGNFDLSVVVNFPVQATAADIFDLDLRDVCEALPDIDPSARFIIHGHDAAYVECAEEHAEAITPMMTEKMTRTVEHNGVRMFFPADAHAAKTWSEL